MEIHGLALAHNMVYELVASRDAMKSGKSNKKEMRPSRFSVKKYYGTTTDTLNKMPPACRAFFSPPSRGFI